MDLGMQDDKIKIPNKLYFDISEVSELTGVKPYVLRYWESEFTQLKPTKTSKGQRKYKKKDIEKILEIKELLRDENYTIAGARKKLTQKQTEQVRKPDLYSIIEDTKKELYSLRDMLSRPVQPRRK